MLINITDLSIKYGSKIVLKGMDLSLVSGEIVTIVGPNGSGKTSLFKAIIGTAPVSTGKIEIRPDLKIGYVPQQIKIDQSLPMTAERFLTLIQKMNKRLFGKELDLEGT